MKLGDHAVRIDRMSYPLQNGIHVSDSKLVFPVNVLPRKNGFVQRNECTVKSRQTLTHHFGSETINTNHGVMRNNQIINITK